MQIHHPHPPAPEDGGKGWYVGTWNGTFPFPVGYAMVGIDDPHVHTRVMEVFLVARGHAQLRIELWGRYADAPAAGPLSDIHLGIPWLVAEPAPRSGQAESFSRNGLPLTHDLFLGR